MGRPLATTRPSRLTALPSTLPPSFHPDLQSSLPPTLHPGMQWMALLAAALHHGGLPSLLQIRYTAWCNMTLPLLHLEEESTLASSLEGKGSAHDVSHARAACGLMSRWAVLVATAFNSLRVLRGHEPRPSISLSPSRHL